MPIYLFSVIRHTAKLVAYPPKALASPKTYDFFEKVGVARVRRHVRMIMTVTTLLQQLHVLLGRAVYPEHDLAARDAKPVDVTLGPSVQRAVNYSQQFVIITVPKPGIHLLPNVLAIEPVQFPRLIDAYHADRVPFAKAKVLLAILLVKPLQIRETGARVQQIQRTIHTLDRPSRLYHYLRASLLGRRGNRTIERDIYIYLLDEI